MKTSVTVGIKRASALVKNCMTAGLVPMLKSAPGLGKSSLYKSLADQAKLKVIDVRLSQCEPTDLNGLPFIVDGRASYNPFDIFPVSTDKVPEGYRGWMLLLDEANSADRAVLAGVYKLVLDRQVGNHDLHPQVYIVMAGNRSEDKAIVNEMGSALDSRIVHLNVEANLNDWREWAIDHGIDSRLISFIEFRPTLLHDFNPEKYTDTFPCPRTWEMTDKLLKVVKEPRDVRELISGTVGPGAATEFLTFCDVYGTLPTLGEILANPEEAKVPYENSAQFAMMGFLADQINEKNADKLMTYLKRYTPEKQIIAIRIITPRKPTLASTPAFRQIFASITKYL